MKSLRLIIFVLLFLPHQALALSCAQPSMNEFVVTGATLIFEGTAQERTGRATGDAFGQRIYQFKFTVDKMWKGSVFGGEVTIYLDTYWGDDFVIGKDYLVVAEDVNGELHSPLCGNTVALEDAEDQLILLEQILASGTEETDEEQEENLGLEYPVEEEANEEDTSEQGKGIGKVDKEQWFGR